MTTSETEMKLPALNAPARAEGVLKKRRRGKPSTFWRIRDDIPRWLELGLMGASALLPLIIWTALNVTHAVNPIFLPRVDKVIMAGYDMLSSGELLTDTLASSQRVAIGFSISLLIAVPLGLAIGTFRTMRALFEPVIGMVRYAPATAFVPLLLIWLGLGETSKIA